MRQIKNLIEFLRLKKVFFFFCFDQSRTSLIQAVLASTSSTLLRSLILPRSFNSECFSWACLSWRSFFTYVKKSMLYRHTSQHVILNNFLGEDPQTPPLLYPYMLLPSEFRVLSKPLSRTHLFQHQAFNNTDQRIPLY